MSKRLNAKYKINRRLGENLWGRPKSPVNVRAYAPGQHGAQRKKLTDYGTQLFAKQKLRGYYGNIGEKHFHRIYQEAVRLRGDTVENMIRLLESRLDTVVYRLKFVPTVFAARQFVNHGHVLVNGQRVNISSYRVKPGDVISMREKSREIPMVMEALASAERDVPSYLECDPSAGKGSFLRYPQFDEVPYPVKMEPHLIVEFYSR